MSEQCEQKAKDDGFQHVQWDVNNEQEQRRVPKEHRESISLAQAKPTICDTSGPIFYVPSRFGSPAGVYGLRLGHYVDRGSARPRTPAQISVFGEQEVPVVEPSDLPEQRR